jgi:drug/metabolite transporter (DMT)-like permease
MLFSAAIYTFLIIIYASMNVNTIYKDIHNITKKDIIIILLTSAIATFMANVLYYTILKNHESSLIYSSPIFTLILAYIFLKERINTIGIFGILFIVVGIIFIAMNNGTSKELEYFTII